MKETLNWTNFFISSTASLLSFPVTSLGVHMNAKKKYTSDVLVQKKKKIPVMELMFIKGQRIKLVLLDPIRLAYQTILSTEGNSKSKNEWMRIRKGSQILRTAAYM